MQRRRIPVNPWRFETPQATVQIKTGPYYTAVWKRAITAWNAKKVFKFNILNGPAQITIQPAQANEASLVTHNYVGVAYVNYDTTKRITDVKVHLIHTLLKKYAYTTTQRVNVAEHELGHAMGLAHNPNKQSVMYKTTRYVDIQPVDVSNVQYLYSLPPAQYFINTTVTTTTTNTNTDIASDALLKTVFTRQTKEAVRVVSEQY
ncbi:matrixin family metalloprotease [Secundilactobacillus hailunensis]|uniref:Matrixin family metalloprotease n=1 Tax=Secundilactobacillus hailunensis TaxID=2559923 RepID=A0ABW1T6B9_9LACO|nr:matrixin family metalloprotease [Secundilactobacillus hailunensis]